MTIWIVWSTRTCAPPININKKNEDYDDNKFVDCVLKANADFIIIHDKHFNILQNIDFPKIDTLSAQEFMEKLAENLS